MHRERLLTRPDCSFFLFGPRGTGKSTWIREQFPGALRFDLLSEGTIAAKASLSFDRPPVKLRCRNCATTFSPENLNWACPNCREQKVEIVSGRECCIESIEIE